MESPLNISSWPRAIVHIDGDSFFASVEQALNPSLKKKPVVTGKERGIAVALSLEAKKLGITRGMPITQIKRNHPECIVVGGHYEAYMAFAKRMFTIMRSFTPIVEEYSIDEAFADITGMRRYYQQDYKTIGANLQAAIEKDLDITVSVGISLTKSLAKLCSKFRKPHGLTCVKGTHIHILLQKTPIERVWGIGPNTAALLRKYACQSAYDFAKKPSAFVNKYLTKKELEIYTELHGKLVYPVSSKQKDTYQSISKSHTFEPLAEKSLIFAQLARNIEEASAKCRKYKLACKGLIIMLKTQQFIKHGTQTKISRPTASATEIIAIARQLYEECFEPGHIYRTTMCVLTDLVPDKHIQLTIFDTPLSIEKNTRLHHSLDYLNRSYGKGTIHLASSLPARNKNSPGIKIPTLNIHI